MAMTYDLARSEYEAASKGRTPYDITGAFVTDDAFWRLMQNPCKREAARLYEELLDYAEHAGWGDDGEPT